jgi:colanic acid/amylovoran biosynthesis protein
MARRVLDRCSWIMARESLSLAFLRGLKLRSPALRLVPDAAFAFRDDGPGERELEDLAGLERGGRPMIGISAKPHHFPGHPDAAVRFERYLDSLAAAADHAVEFLGARVVFVPQCVGSAGEDREIARMVAARMAAPDHALVVERELSPFGLSALYGRLDLMIGTRMHANILSMACGVPALAIGYEHKTTGIMAMVGLPDLMIDIAAITPEFLVARLDDAWARRCSLGGYLAGVVPGLIGLLETGVAEALSATTLQAQSS